MKIGKLILLFTFTSSILFGQGSVMDASIEELIKGKDAYILDEDLEINIYGKDHFSTAFRFFRINREFTVKILNKNGLERFRSMNLPEDFDPTYKPHAPAVKKLGIYYSAYKIEEFKVQVKRSGVKPFSPKVKRKVNQIESFNINYLYTYSQHEYNIEGLEVGDEVTIRYDLTIPFQENYSRFASYRIFFHGDIPKQSYKLALTNHEQLDIEIFKKNGAETKLARKEDKIETRIWELKNLPGCINEDGGRPYLELPHITWVINHYKYYAHNSNDQVNLPHYAIIASLRSSDLPGILLSVEVGSQSRQFAPFTEAYDKMTEGIAQDYGILKSIHTTINEEFKYDKNIEYYRRNDMRGERLGEFFQQGILRDMSRYNAYYAIMVKNQMQFFSAYTIDKRFGEISDEYFMPNFDSDYLLAAYFGERLFDIILPKRNKYGWYYNEIPFYWEDTKSRLVHISDYAQYRYPVKDIFRSIQTQKTAAIDNVRNHEITMEVGENGGVKASGKVVLTGQFSTMCRMAYLNGYKDPTVDQRYSNTIWRSIGNCIEVNLENQVISSNYPFRSQFDFVFENNDVADIESGEMILNLKNFFPHISPKSSSDQVRFLNYYADFLGEDEFLYTLKFEKEIEFFESISFGYENEFGFYKFIAKKTGSAEITVSSKLIVKTEFLSRSSYQDAQDIFNSIERANGMILKIK